MKTQSTNPMLYILFSLLVVVIVILLLFVFSTPNMMMGRLNMGSSFAEEDMDEMMEEMMGTRDNDDLPTVTPAERVAQLESTVAADGTKEFVLTAKPIAWEYANDQTITAWGYNGQVPGPMIRVTEGDNVRVQFTNQLPKATTLHWHGVNVPYDQDGVPGVSQEPIAPGETYTYEFRAAPAGTRYYHTHGSSHTDEAQQLDMGLAGAFIIDPPADAEEAALVAAADKDITLVLDEWQTGFPDGEMHNMAMMNMEDGGHMMNYNLFTINGRAFPDTEPISVAAGETVRLRLINAGTSTTHPMHLHGHSFKVVAVDGNAVPAAAQLTRDTITIAPGERYDIEFEANNPGVWVFHCHELHHADDGMIVPFVYDGYELSANSIEDDNDEALDNGDGRHSMHGNY